jgi:hypothetical protein
MGTGREMLKKEWRYEQDAGPSTASLAIRLRETPLRMTDFLFASYLQLANIRYERFE